MEHLKTQKKGCKLKHKIGDPVYYDDGKFKSFGVIVDIRKYPKDSGSFYTINWNPPIPFKLHSKIMKEYTHVGSDEIKKYREKFNREFTVQDK